MRRARPRRRETDSPRPPQGLLEGGRPRQDGVDGDEAARVERLVAGRDAPGEGDHGIPARGRPRR